MTDLSMILYGTIKDYELEQRINRNDRTFDAFEYFSRLIGHKNSSTLRKMCEPREPGANSAKLGIDEAVVIMTAAQDYRLLAYMRQRIEQELAGMKNDGQLSLFARPIRAAGAIDTEVK